MMKTYTELRRLDSFLERFEYLSLKSVVGRYTFGSERFLNQQFYASREWRNVRRDVIDRDGGLDLGVEGYDIFDQISVHHMNPITMEDVENHNPEILDPDLLISVSHETHNAIHYGDKSRLRLPSLVERRPGDTRPW
jgi:hypothetical protein